MMTIEGKIIFLLRLLLFPCLTFAVSLFLTRFSINMLRRYGFIAEMGSRHIHKKVIPTAGGIGMITAFILSSTVYNLWVKFFNTSPEIKLIPYDFFLPVMLLFFIGIYDDRFGMRAVIKLCGQIAAALLAGLILLNRAVLGGMMFEGALIILFILPPPFIIPVFANEPAERAEISASLSAMTLLTMLLFAIASILMKV